MKMSGILGQILYLVFAFGVGVRVVDYLTTLPYEGWFAIVIKGVVMVFYLLGMSLVALLLVGSRLGALKRGEDRYE